MAQPLQQAHCLSLTGREDSVSVELMPKIVSVVGAQLLHLSAMYWPMPMLDSLSLAHE